MKELTIPEAAHRDRASVEVLRAWVADKKQHGGFSSRISRVMWSTHTPRSMGPMERRCSCAYGTCSMPSWIHRQTSRVEVSLPTDVHYFSLSTTKSANATSDCFAAESANETSFSFASVA
jgi:hypothetical protein